MSRWHTTGLVFAVFAVVVVVALVYGFATYREPGLVRVCDGPGRVARYSPPAVCDAHDLVWPRDRIPLRVGPAAPAVVDAVREVNSQMGFALLRMGEPADVTITLGVSHESSWHDAAATTWHDLAPMHAEIRVSNVGDVATLHAVLVHELGHALGLAHADAEDAVMYPVAGGVRFTDADRAIMRRLYGER